MKITIVQGPFLPVPPLLGGAAEKAWFGLGQAFAAAGHEVLHLSRALQGLPTEELIAGVHHRRLPSRDAAPSLAVRLLLDLRYSRRVLRALPKADILVTNTFWLPILKRGTDKGVPYVHVARYPKGQLRYYGKHAILQTVSGPIRDAILQEIPEAEDRISLIPYPLPAPYLQPARAKHKKALLYAGRVHPEKGLGLLLKAFALASPRLSGWELRIVGPHEFRQGGGGEAYLKQLQHLAQGLPVVFTGPKFKQEDLLAEYDEAPVFVYPSLAERGETFGLALLEAMARGCMPICSSLACFGDFIRTETNGLIFDHRSEMAPHKLAELMILAGNSPELLARLADNALRESANYSTPAVAGRFLLDFQARIRANQHS